MFAVSTEPVTGRHPLFIATDLSFVYCLYTGLTPLTQPPNLQLH